jgi:8-oxo-dGTP pyrophosphatase MutT (NUDIX family)
MSTPTPDNPPEPSWTKPDAGAHDRTLAKTWLFELKQERYQSRKTRKTHDFFVAHLADGVHVIAVTPENQVVMVRQFRAGPARDTLETPGGLVNPGEDPLIAGPRELLEETGYAGQPSVILGPITPNPALLSMRITTILVQNAQPIATQHLDPDEEVSIELIPANQILNLIQSGAIDHAAVVAGLLWWLAREKPLGPA